eukprot:13458714-Alexandrium_andersonii.AAC.1
MSTSRRSRPLQEESACGLNFRHCSVSAVSKRILGREAAARPPEAARRPRRRACQARFLRWRD